MKESASNIAMMCSEHSPKPDPRWAEKPLEFFVGKFVKTGFLVIHPISNKETLEHMWVEVTGVDAETKRLVGALNNEPVYATELILGDTVFVDPARIEAVLGKSRESP